MKSIIVKGTQTHDVDVTLSPRDRNKIAIEYIREAMGIRPNSFIREGKLVYEWEQSYGSHSDWEEKVVSDATEADLAALVVLQYLAGLTYE